MNLRSVLALTLLTATPALAQPAPAPTQATTAAEMDTFEKELDALFSRGGLTAEEAASRARKVSPAVARSFAELEIAITQTQAAELARIPQLGASASYNRLSSIEQPVIAFPTGDPNMPSMGFSFPVLLNTFTITGRAALTLSDYLLRYPKAIDAAKLGEQVARERQKASEVDAAQEARLAYYEWVRSQLQVLVARRQLAQVRSTLGQVRALAEVQRVSRADLMRVESQEAVAEQTAIQLENLSALREEQLRVLIGAPPGQPLTIGEDIRVEVAAPGAAQTEELVGIAKKQRLEFRAIQKGIEATEKQREAERANLFPKLSAFAQADYANPNQRIFPQTGEFNLTWVLGVSVSWNINEPLFARNADRRLRAQVKQLESDRENLERGTRIEVLAAQQGVVVAQAALATSQKGLAAAEEGYRVRRELLNAQRATAVELVDAETDLTRARINALNARVDLRVALAELANAIGNDAK